MSAMLERQRSFRRVSLLNPDQKVADLPYALCLNVRAVAWFLDQGGDPNNYVHGLGLTTQTPLHVAAENDADEAVRALVRGGADPNARSSTHSTPLHDALKKSAWRAARALLENGARVDVVNVFNETPLEIAQAKQADESLLNLLRPPPTPSARSLRQKRSALAAQRVREGSLRTMQSSSVVQLEDKHQAQAPSPKSSASPAQSSFLNPEQLHAALQREAGIKEVSANRLLEAGIDSNVISYMGEDGMVEAGITSALDRARILAWASKNKHRENRF